MRVFWDSYGLDNAQSGIGVYGREIYQRLIDQGVCPTLIGATSRRLEPLYQFAEKNSSPLLRKLKLLVPGDIKACLREELNSDQKFIVHGLSNFNVLTGRRAKNCKVVLTVHDFIPYKFPGSVSSWYRFQIAHLMPKAMAAADAIVCVSHATQRDLQTLFPQYAPKSLVIPNGVKRPLLSPVGSSVTTVAKSILTVSRGEAYKNLHLIPQILQKLDTDTKWTLITDSQTSANMRLAFADLLQGGKLNIIADVGAAQLGEAYQSADLHISLSDYEGFGFPIVESLLAGSKTAVLGSVGVTDYLTKDLYFDLSQNRHDLSQLADEIRHILLIPHPESARQTLRTLANQALPTWEGAANKLISLYNSL
jgi:glycosyltransferase involved in cell wall biosynthesis